MHLDPNLKGRHLYLQISLSFRKRQTVSGEMKGLRGEDVVCSQASMWCLVLGANIKFVSLNVVKPTFYFFIYLSI